MWNKRMAIIDHISGFVRGINVSIVGSTISRTRSTYWMSFASYTSARVCIRRLRHYFLCPFFMPYSGHSTQKNTTRSVVHITDVPITEQKCCLCYYDFTEIISVYSMLEFVRNSAASPINVEYNDFSTDWQFYYMVSHYHCICMVMQKLPKENVTSAVELSWTENEAMLFARQFLRDVFFWLKSFCVVFYLTGITSECARLRLLTFHCWKSFRGCMCT